MSTLTIRLLGAPAILQDGAPVALDTRKALALLAYLVVADPHGTAALPRDTLAALLWPDADAAHARGALRRTLSTLKGALGDDALEADRERVRLRRTPAVTIDLDRFQELLAATTRHGHGAVDVCAACLPLLAEAADLYRGEFLAGFSLRDSPEFDDWLSFQSERLRSEAAHALERLARGHAAQGQFAPAIAHARRRLSLDPLHEPAHQQLMLLYAWDGQYAAALRQYRACVRVFEQELGVPPLEETTRLHEAIKERRAPSPPEAARAPAPPPAATLPARETAPHFPLVGRAAEWAALLRAYGAVGPGGQLIVLEGEAGIGKTRLADEFLAHVQQQGAQTVAARCYEGETGLTFSPFVDALRAAAAQPARARRLRDLPAHWLAEVTRLLPELAAPPLAAPPLESPAAQNHFFAGVGQALFALCGATPPGVLFLDDLHWADEASLSLWAYLVRRLAEHPWCIVAAWRGEQVPAGHRLRQTLAEAQRAGRATVIRLARLSRDAVMALVASQGATARTEPLAQRLYQETEALPFFLVEYLNMLAREGDAPPGGWMLPGGVRDLLHARLAAVSETGRQLLSAAAAIGRSFAFDTVRAASGRSPDETVEALEELMARGLIVEAPDGGGALGPAYDFGHEKLRELVYAETSLARKRLLHRRIAEALSAHGRGKPALAAAVAQHFRLAGQDERAAEYFRLAGDHARSLYAHAEALEHYHLALALGHPDAAALHEAIGDLQTLRGDYAAALARYEMAAALCPRAHLGRLEHRLGRVYLRRGEWELARGHFQTALAAYGPEGRDAERAAVCTDWSLAAHRGGAVGEALALAQQGLALAEAAHEPRALAEAHNVLGILARRAGRLDEATHHLQQSLTWAETLGDPGVRVAALNNLALAYGDQGANAEAIAAAHEALALCHAQGDRHRAAALHNNLADLYHAARQPDASMAHLKQAVALFAEIDVQADSVQPEVWKLTEW